MPCLTNMDIYLKDRKMSGPKTRCKSSILFTIPSQARTIGIPAVPHAAPHTLTMCAELTINIRNHYNMGFQIIQKLSSKEKARKCEECLQILQEEGQMPDLESIRHTVLETYSLSQILIKTLHEQEGLSAAAVKLSGQMEKLLTTIKA